MKADNQMTELSNAELVKAIDRGPQQQEEDGRWACPVCGAAFERKNATGLHIRRAHVVTLPHTWQVRLKGHEACAVDGCSTVCAAHNMAQHLRDIHGIYRGATSGRGRLPKAAVAVATPPEPVRAVADVTAVEAGLAVLRGLAPGGAVPVDLLPDVVEWLAAGERLVSAIRER